MGKHKLRRDDAMSLKGPVIMEGMNEIFRAKMGALTKRQSLAEVEKLTGVKAQTIYDARERGRMPRAGTLVNIARAYGVPLSWLADDGEPAEPRPTAPADLTGASDTDLRAEFYRRWDIQHDLLFPLLHRVESLDWPTIAAKLEVHNSLEAVPEELQAPIRLLVELSFVGARLPIMTWSPGLITVGSHEASRVQERVMEASPRLGRLAMQSYGERAQQPEPDPQLTALREALEVCEAHFGKSGTD
ncbi:MAG: helix-turn-helix transcriptional regulator [Phycisphaeraceae bacterium]